MFILVTEKHTAVALEYKEPFSRLVRVDAIAEAVDNKILLLPGAYGAGGTINVLESAAEIQEEILKATRPVVNNTYYGIDHAKSGTDATVKADMLDMLYSSSSVNK